MPNPLDKRTRYYYKDGAEVAIYKTNGDTHVWVLFLDGREQPEINATNYVLDFTVLVPVADIIVKEPEDG